MPGSSSRRTTSPTGGLWILARLRSSTSRRPRLPLHPMRHSPRPFHSFTHSLTPRPSSYCRATNQQQEDAASAAKREEEKERLMQDMLAVFDQYKDREREVDP